MAEALESWFLYIVHLQTFSSDCGFSKSSWLLFSLKLTRVKLREFT